MFQKVRFGRLPKLFAAQLCVVLSLGCETILGPPKPAALAVTTQPTGAPQNGTAFAQQPVVELRKGNGKLAKRADVRITVSLVSGNGTLAGTTSVLTGPNGQGLFTNLSISGTVGDFVLGFTTEGVPEVRSNVLALLPGPPSQLVIVTQPSAAAQSGIALVQQPVIQLRDAAGNDATAIASVTASLGSGGGSLGGGFNVNANANGRASFTDLSIAGLVGTRTLQFTSPGTGLVTSDPIALAAGPANRLVVTQQPSSSVESGATFPQQPVIALRDGAGNGVSQSLVVVTATIASGTGTLGGTPIASTNASGVAAYSDLSITGSGGARTLQFSSPGLISVTSAPITVASATTFDITLRFLTSATAAQQQAFADAIVRWAQLITGDLSDIPMTLAADQCGSNPALNETVDDLLILVELGSIDGPGGILGQAGPCLIRSSNKLPVLGTMQFDTDDLAALQATGRLGAVILHEMGHVLGIGTGLWGPSFFNLLRNPSCPSSPGADTHFSGTQAVSAFDLAGGTTYTGGGKVPVENSQGGCPGTQDGHWRESLLNEELMTGFVEAPGITMPLSRITVASLADIGYQVNLNASDAFSKVFTAPFAVAPLDPRVKTELRNDIWRGPVHEVDARGGVVRVVPQ